ncbi:MAG TPA: nuclear transport factor 2 family protein [Solirubrobacteraceae bacterium]|nr:nuclear transport factor 2 family protein [Solirubrobacteraceae bacterium]
MSQENVEIVRRLLANVNEGDLDAALADVSADAELDWSRSEAPDAGVHRGRDAWREWIVGRQEGLNELRFEETEVIDIAPGAVVLVAHVRGRGPASDLQTTALGASVWTLAGGRITGLTLYQTRDQAVKAVGLAE